METATETVGDLPYMGEKNDSHTVGWIRYIGKR